MDASLIVYALNLSAIYALLAIGISLLWSSIGMMNMAHGASFAVAGYGALVAGDLLLPGINAAMQGSALLPLVTFVVLLAAGVGSGALFGVLIYLLAFLPIHDKANFAVRGLIVTLAINLATVQALLWWFGPRQQALPNIFGFGRLNLLGVPVRYDQAATILATAVLLSVVLSWLRLSRKGLEIRAMMQNAEGAALSGISVRRTALPVMAVTGAMAGAAAVLLSQTVYVSPGAGAMPLIKGMIIALLGGLGSVPGAAVAALLIGALEAGGSYPLDATVYPDGPGTLPLVVTINYTDDFNQPQTITATLDVEVMESAPIDPGFPPDGGVDPGLPAPTESFTDMLVRFLKGLLGLGSGRTTSPGFDPMMPMEPEVFSVPPKGRVGASLGQEGG